MELSKMINFNQKNSVSNLTHYVNYSKKMQKLMKNTQDGNGSLD